MCIAVFDFRAYDRQLPTKLQFREESTIMHVNSHALRSFNSILLDALSDYLVTPPVKPDKTAPELWRLRALTIFSEFFLSQRLEP